MVAQMKLIGRGGGGGGGGAYNVAITARETRVCYVCPTKSSFKIDIKSTARSITKLYGGSCSFNRLLQAHEKFSLRRSSFYSILYQPCLGSFHATSGYGWK